MVTAISDSIVRSIFCYRIWILSKGKKKLFGINCLDLIIANAILMQSTQAFLSALLLVDETVLVYKLLVSLLSVESLFLLISVNSFKIPTFSGVETVDYLFLTGPVCGVITDTFMAGTLTMLLIKSRGEYKRTRSTVNTLILYIVSTDALTLICMAANMIAFVTAQGTFLFIAFFFPLGKLLLNSLLAMLNAREGLRQQMGQSTTLPLSFVHTSDGNEKNLESIQFSQEAHKDGVLSIGPPTF
ncbi:hypothetical protein C8Q80DRAFT_887164 [Daedaleopsis nitida]|nr:hypothetical protein C8Q80DRAFT_887164 [Daedaleopsis nitida]